MGYGNIDYHPGFAQGKAQKRVGIYQYVGLFGKHGIGVWVLVLFVSCLPIGGEWGLGTDLGTYVGEAGGKGDRERLIE